MAIGKKRKKAGWRGNLLVTIMFISSIIFLPTTVLLFVGMLPTIVVGIVDRTKERVRALTIGFMNFSGCFPYWLDLVSTDHTPEAAFKIITQPSTIVVMYMAAAIGYLIEWAMTGIVSNVLVQRGYRRLENIDDQKEKLIKRWGSEVTGEVPLDIHGFAVEAEESAKESD